MDEGNEELYKYERNVTVRDSELGGPGRWGIARDERQEQVLLMLLGRVDMALCTENTRARAAVRIHWSCSTVKSCVRRESVFLNLFRKCAAHSRTVADLASRRGTFSDCG